MDDLSFVIGRDGAGGYHIASVPQINLAAGNAQFFDPHPSRLVQLRPLMKADVAANGSGRTANALLLVRGENGDADLACYVRVPPHLRKNNRAGVMRAIQCVRRFNGKMADKVMAVAARSTWSAS